MVREKKEQKNISIAWLNFCIYSRLPLGIIIGIANIASAYTDIQYWSPLLVLFFIIDIATIVIYILTYIYAKRFTKKGFKFLYSSLIIESILMSLSLTNNITENSFDNYYTIWVFCLLAIFLLWFLPNHIYLKKRMHLFIDYNEKVNEDKVMNINDTEAISSKTYDISNKTKFCKICGGKLTNEKRCSKCGKQYFYFKPFIFTSNIKITILLFMLIISIGFNIIQLYFGSSNVTNLKSEITDLQDENLNLLIKQNEYEEKANFLDENIVLVIEGYGNYYYTYDCAEKLTGGDYSYWAYNKEQALSNGYKRGSC